MQKLYFQKYSDKEKEINAKNFYLDVLRASDKSNLEDFDASFANVVLFAYRPEVISETFLRNISYLIEIIESYNPRDFNLVKSPLSVAKKISELIAHEFKLYDRFDFFSKCLPQKNRPCMFMPYEFYLQHVHTRKVSFLKDTANERLIHIYPVKTEYSNIYFSKANSISKCFSFDTADDSYRRICEYLIRQSSYNSLIYCFAGAIEVELTSLTPREIDMINVYQNIMKSYPNFEEHYLLQCSNNVLHDVLSKV